MISPHTPPGTKVVALTNCGSPWEAGFTICGKVYIVSSIVKYTPGYGSPECEFGVELSGVTHFYKKIDAGFLCIFPPITNFRRLDLPECLTSLLNSAPVDQEGRPLVFEPFGQDRGKAMEKHSWPASA